MSLARHKTCRRSLLVVAGVLLIATSGDHGRLSAAARQSQRRSERPGHAVETGPVTTASVPAQSDSSVATGVTKQRTQQPVLTPREGGRPDAGRSSRPAFPSALNVLPVDDLGRATYVPDRLIVRFQNDVPENRQRALIKAEGAAIVSALDPAGSEYVVALAPGMQLADAADRFGRLPEIDYVEPDILYYIDALPTDSLYANFSGNPNDLQRWYFNGADDDRGLNAEAAWDITTGNAGIVMAIIDTGIAANHPDLAGNLWTNPGEIPDNGIDDDGNGFIDDVYGWDFFNNDNNPSPDLGDGWGDQNVFHGTFVAGCAAAVSDNAEGIVGACWHARLMALKVFTDDGGAPSSAISRALYYAINNGAHVVNMSFGSSVASTSISRAVKSAWSKGLVLVAAAGNQNSTQRSYPARYPNVIAVGGLGAINANGLRSRAWFSQYGPQAVDVVAPAVNIVGTGVLSVADQLQGWGQAGEPNYLIASGTSFAAPLVAGQVALLMSRAQDLGLTDVLANEDYRAIVLSATTDLPDDPSDSPDGGATWDGRGRVDFLAALEQVGPGQVRIPSAPAKLRARTTSATSVLLTWKDRSNNEQGFRIERAVSVGGVLGEFQIAGETGANETSFVDSSTQPAIRYYYRVWAANLAGESASAIVRARLKNR
jgi:subtilisin family serine protease